MKQFKLLKEIFGAKEGTYFVPLDDTSYRSASGSITINSSLIEENPEYFQEEVFDLWKPGQPGEAFYLISIDLGVAEIAWDEQRFNDLWMAGNVFRDRESAKEAAQAVAVLVRTYQKKFSKYIEEHPKEPKILAAPAVAQQPTPASSQPYPQPQQVVVGNPFDRFVPPQT